MNSAAKSADSLTLRCNLLLFSDELSIIELSMNTSPLLSAICFNLLFTSNNLRDTSNSSLWVIPDIATLLLGNYDFTHSTRSFILETQHSAVSDNKLFVPA